VDAELIRAVRALATGARTIERALDEMTLPQFRVLALIASSPERANRLAEKAAVSRPSLTGLLDGLEAKGWVRRIDVEGDRRGVTLRVTREGAAALRHAERAMGERLDRVLRADGADRDAVVRGLDALGVALRAHSTSEHEVVR
jgi:DNA-binding MarR family transcriptional regulator